MLKEATFFSASPAETKALGKQLGEHLFPGLIIAAQGDLGAGKTLFAQGLGEGLGIHTTITSPTFMIYQEYDQGRIPFAHIDAYRLEGLSEEEIALTGIGDALALNKTAFVEWPQFLLDWLPQDTLWLDIRKTGEESRKFTFRYDEAKEAWLHAALGH